MPRSNYDQDRSTDERILADSPDVPEYLSRVSLPEDREAIAFRAIQSVVKGRDALELI